MWSFNYLIYITWFVQWKTQIEIIGALYYTANTSDIVVVYYVFGNTGTYGTVWVKILHHIDALLLIK